MNPDWGSVPDWVAAVGTVGTLVVALAIIALDRRKEERAHADNLVTWIHPPFFGGSTSCPLYAKPHLHLHAYNAGSRPVMRAWVGTQVADGCLDDATPVKSDRFG